MGPGCFCFFPLPPRSDRVRRAPNSTQDSHHCELESGSVGTHPKPSYRSQSGHALTPTRVGHQSCNNNLVGLQQHSSGGPRGNSSHLRPMCLTNGRAQSESATTTGSISRISDAGATLSSGSCHGRHLASDNRKFVRNRLQEQREARGIQAASEWIPKGQATPPVQQTDSPGNSFFKSGRRA